MVVSDHSPCTPDLKRTDTGDFAAAWGGIAGLQFSFSAVWTEAHARGIGLERVVEWMCERPRAPRGHLAGRKGAIAAGADADLVAFDPDATFVVTAPFIAPPQQAHAYEGETLRGGRVERQTYLRGASPPSPCPASTGRTHATSAPALRRKRPLDHGSPPLPPRRS
jgi:allantoinase